MKTTLLAATGVACLLTSGIAMVAAEAEKPTTHPGSEAIDAQGGAQTDMDDVGAEHPRADIPVSEAFERLDINQDYYLNAYELGAYDASNIDDPAQRDRGRELLDRFDRDGDGLVDPAEFEEMREES